jgi:hypothetical protein
MLDDGIIKTNLEWTSALDIDYQPTNTRKTSIICTIGISLSLLSLFPLRGLFRVIHITHEC